ncbi:heme biosynthesis HemY N-terminal domain-containing protein [Pseudomonas sp. RIT-PI-AD]|uniref:heme biosynthesis HemY N-terminal domain-containing protein n=1 Tax=Pseudomonas sp. RIT-PI-AD TaxID=3035294 RepID=UPI0021D8B437|nr:heme biosynthesis HemY N-terminal domain-containing protein [Pseudomonas sp. RIT-PI-AD]
MKRVGLLILLLLVAAGLALLGLAIAEHKGYVLIAYEGFRYEASLWATLALVAVVVLLLYLLRLLIVLLAASGGALNPWSRRHKQRRVRQASEQGFLDLAEGRWARAQRHLKRAAEADPQPLVYYLGAARAAHELGEHAESDALLERALERQPQAELAIALTHAELQQARGEPDKAEETLEAMRSRHPHHHQVLRQLQRLYVQRGAWSAAIGLLPELRKEKILGESELNALERHVWTQRLAEAGQPAADGESPLQDLTRAWQQVPSAQRNEPALVAAYAGQLRRLDAQEEAEQVIRQALKRQYDSHLVREYGLLRGADPARQLQTAEGWLAQQPGDPALLLTLGRLCLHNQLWGKARDYLESSLTLQRDPETCAELAHLLAELGEVERSNQLFREGFDTLERRQLPRPSALQRVG